MKPASLLSAAPLVLVACSAAAPLPEPATPPPEPAPASVRAEGAVAPTLTAKLSMSDPLPAPDEGQSKAPAPSSGVALGDDKTKTPEPAFPDRRSVEAMDRLAVSIPVRRTARGDLVTLASDDTFEPGSATTTLSARWRLDDLATALAAQSGRRIRILVYADDVGDREESKRLSRVRADTLRDYFVAHGARAEAIEASGPGPAHPVASNATAQGRRENRRIEVLVEPARRN
jgi:outer membrane protein OmpA-like peptidoglycan-associated protein